MLPTFTNLLPPHVIWSGHQYISTVQEKHNLNLLYSFYRIDQARYLTHTLIYKSGSWETRSHGTHRNILMFIKTQLFDHF